MREVLEAEGYRVTCAPNGREALKAFERETPDLIVSDVMMPFMDGFTLLKHVRAHPAGAAVPFLFLSARTEPAATSHARQLGADDFLFKPFDADDLSLAVRARLERRQTVERFDTHAAHLQTVGMLANVVEARDRYTRGHVERVKTYAAALARTLQWTEAALAVLEFGALLHDLGKILVPRTVLNKPGRLLPAGCSRPNGTCCAATRWRVRRCCKAWIICAARSPMCSITTNTGTARATRTGWPAPPFRLRGGCWPW